MRRADRLFQIVQLLRRDRITTGAKLAAELEISERTLYRDIADLMASGVPIESEPGVGYRLPRAFELPPLMFTREEVEALVVGARMVRAWSDAQLGEAASAVLRKVEAALPLPLKQRLEDLPILVPGFFVPRGSFQHLGLLREALRENRKVRMAYVRADGQASERVVRPLGLSFWGSGWSLAAWCELRQELRTFRPDRIQALAMLEESFQPEPGKRFEDYLARQREAP